MMNFPNPEELWRDEYPAYGTEGRPGFEIHDLLSEAKDENASRTVPSIGKLVRCFDEFALWYVSLIAVLWEGTKLHDDKHVSRKVYLALLSHVCHQHFAIRQLVLNGFDIAAKQILRSLVENLDVAVLMGIRPELQQEFLKTESAEASNAFWHRHLARGKARRVIEAHLTELACDKELMAKWGIYRKREDDLLSMTAHPSYGLSSVCALMPTDADWLTSDAPFWPGCLGGLSRLSERTLQYAMACSSVFIDVTFHSLVTEEKHGALVPLSESDDLHRHLKYGRKVLMRILHILAK